MKFIIDFFPLVVFFIAYKMDDIYTATAAIMVATFLQIVVNWLIKRSFEKVHVVTFIVLLIFGSMTLILHDDVFIKWKFSIVMWCIGGFFLVRQWWFKHNTIKDIFSASSDQPMQAPEKVWRRCNNIIGFGHVLMGFLNLYIAFGFSQDVWVNFKVFGGIGLSLLMMTIVVVQLYPYLQEANKQA